MVSIVNGAIQINQLRENALLSQGKLVANTWTHISKFNLVEGQIGGNFNLITSALSLLIDPDVFDNNLPNAGGQAANIGANPEVF